MSTCADIGSSVQVLVHLPLHELTHREAFVVSVGVAA